MRASRSISIDLHIEEERETINTICPFWLLMAEGERIKQAVKESYRALAEKRSSLNMINCCESDGESKTEKLMRYGYSSAELEWVPESVKVMSDGCGNPTGLGMIEVGDTVLDLGSGGGIDVLLASRKVGATGRVVGLDMTPAMVESATENARKLNFDNVEFKLGEIEQIPLPDSSVDVIISNCVICLSPEKEAVFREMFRVLADGGRLAVADEIATDQFSETERTNPEKWCSCVSGAITEDEYASALRKAGFEHVYVKQLRPSTSQAPKVFSAFISATKPSG
jgi:arsenite methyltransferase